MNDPDRAWFRALPLLLSSSVLLIAGALMFFRAEDSVASIASMTAGVLAFGAWMATAIIDWYAARRRYSADQPEVEG